MNTNVIIIEIDAQISRLKAAKAVLAGPEIPIERKQRRPSGANLSDSATSSIPAKSAAKPAARRTVSTEAREKMAATQKARWAKVKRAPKKAAVSVAAAPAVKSTSPQGAVSKTAPPKKNASVKKVVRAKRKTPVTQASLVV